MLHNTPVPHLTTAYKGPLLPIEEIILKNLTLIETWFRNQWEITSAPITSSVDLRNAGFKLSPVDTNLFPAGFNNINQDFLPMCIQAFQSVLGNDCLNILIIPESHTRNLFYMQSLATLRDVLTSAGFVVRIGNLDATATTNVEVALDGHDLLLIEPLVRQKDSVGLMDFKPNLILMNNDLSAGIPEILINIKEKILPAVELGWASRLKSSHFDIYSEVAAEFAALLQIDPWLITPLFSTLDGIDFMQQIGVNQLADEVDMLLTKIREKYALYGIKEKPFVVVKADSGTYGMGVMMVHNGAEILNLNRKQRTSMSKTKGSRKVSRVLIQEGVYTVETLNNGAVAEPVVYMIGSFVVGGFYRVHQERESNENLNSPGMYFEPLAFAKACNMPSNKLSVHEPPNRFYIYGVIARLAALAAAREGD